MELNTGELELPMELQTVDFGVPDGGFGVARAVFEHKLELPTAGIGVARRKRCQSSGLC